MLTHLSLFSGIGGLDIAAEMAGFVTIGQCENADYQTKVLERHWPDVPRWRDIRELTKRGFTEETYMAAHRKDYDQAVDMYSAGMSIEEIAAYYGVTRQSMHKCLQRRGVEFRSNLKYGTDNHFCKCHHVWHKKNEAKGVVPYEAMPRTNINVLSGGFP